MTKLNKIVKQLRATKDKDLIALANVITDERVLQNIFNYVKEKK